MTWKTKFAGIRRRLAGPFAGYLIATFSVATAAFAYWLIAPTIGPRLASLFMFLSVVAAGRYGGKRPAWFALALSALLIAGRFYARGPAANPSLMYIIMAVYVALGALLVLLTNSERSAREAAEREAAESRRIQEQLQSEIAERQAVERRLRQQHQQLELALSAGRMGAYQWTPATGDVQFSSTTAAIMGLAELPQSMTLDFVLERIHPEDRPMIEQACVDAWSRGDFTLLAYRVIWPDGSIHWIESSGTFGYDEDGQPTCILGVSADITKRKQAEIALRQAEERFRNLALMAPVGIAQSDPEGRTFFVNEKYCEIMGAPAEQLMGYAWMDRLHFEDRQTLLDDWRAAMDAGKPLSTAEFRIVHPDGAIRWGLGCSVMMTDEHGAPLGQIGTLLDVTTRKLADDNLQAERELLRRVIDVQEQESRMICIEIHDGVLQYAAGSLMLLETCQRQHELPPPAKETLDDVIQKLRSAVDDGRRVIRGVRPSVLDDLGIVAAIEDLVERCGRDGLVVRFTYGPTSGLRKTHELTLYRIAQEALNNVKKHSGAGEAEIDLRQIDGRVTLAVRDFGRGFDVRKPRLSGFGVLGMTERVRLAGGQCVVESRPGAGTTVIAELPASSAGESDSQAPGSLKPEPQATEPLTPELRRLEPPALPALDSQTSAADFDASRPTSLEAATSLSAPRTGAPTVSGAG